MSIVNEVQIPKVRRTRITGLSHSFDFNCKIGELIPFLCEEMVAGDICKVGVDSVVQFPALQKPMFSNGMHVDFFYFLVPLRTAWKEWVNFLPVYQTYDENGVNTTPALPLLSNPSGVKVGDSSPTISFSELRYDGTVIDESDKFSLSDYLGCKPIQTYVDSECCPLDFGHRAYLMIYEYFFRDENLDSHVWDFDSSSPIVVKLSQSNKGITAGIQSRAWKKDYFVGGTPWIQKGVAPALPLYGEASLTSTSLTTSNNADILNLVAPYNGNYALVRSGPRQSGTTGINQNTLLNISSAVTGDVPDGTQLGIDPRDIPNDVRLKDGSVDLTKVTSADISELWTSIQIQKFLERNAHVGTRYNEFLLAHYGVAPRDETLQRPVFLGSTRQPVFVSEVTQNSESNTTPQGTKTGKAISTGSDYVCTVRVNEPSILMGIMCITPRALYTQGCKRFFLKRSPYDFYNRLFENLVDQPTYLGEIFYTSRNANTFNTFNFMPRYAEYKLENDRVAGDLRDSLSMWHTGRIFTDVPNFNEAFLHQGYDSLDRIFAVQGDTRNCIVHINNRLEMLRPMSYFNSVGAHI